MLPPGVKPTWDDNNEWVKALIMQYHLVRNHEETKWQLDLAIGGRM